MDLDWIENPTLPRFGYDLRAGNKKSCHGIYQAGVFVLEVSLKGELQ